jgi:hypothetical protein
MNYIVRKTVISPSINLNPSKIKHIHLLPRHLHKNPLDGYDSDNSYDSDDDSMNYDKKIIIEPKKSHIPTKKDDY